MQADSMPRAHCAFLERALPQWQADPRIVGVAVAGSYVSASMDEFSDLDLVIAVEPADVASLMQARHQIAAQLGSLLAAFTGEHVGEPRLLVCLYADDDGGAPLHVDLKFVSLPDVAFRVDETVVLWERAGRLGQALQAAQTRYPVPDLRWIEDRFWVWVHYATLKIGRGELFEAVDFLAFLRFKVLGPLVLLEAGAQPTGVRRVETAAPARALQLQTTVASYDRESCIRCLYAAVELYRELRQVIGADDLVANENVESAAMSYLANIAAR